MWASNIKHCGSERDYITFILQHSVFCDKKNSVLTTRPCQIVIETQHRQFVHQFKRKKNSLSVSVTEIVRMTTEMSHLRTFEYNEQLTLLNSFCFGCCSSFELHLV